MKDSLKGRTRKVIVGGEEFLESYYIFAGKEYSHIHGCCGDRFFEAQRRERAAGKLRGNNDLS